MNHFKCTNCGNCCRRYGFVHIFPKDFEIIKRRLKIHNNKNDILKYFDFVIEKYKLIDFTLNVPRLILKIIDNNCVFHLNNSCLIHNFKPMVCKTAPLNYTVLITENARLQYAKICKQFKKLKSHHNYDVYSSLEGVKKELEYENDYLMKLKSHKFKEIYNINFAIKWNQACFDINKKIGEIWPLMHIKLLEIYNNAFQYTNSEEMFKL